MKVLIVFYGKEEKPPELYYLNNIKDLEKYNYRIIELSKHRALFAVFHVGECVGDFS